MELPELPEPDLHEGITLRDGGKYAGTEDGYTAERTRAYAAAAVEAERERLQDKINALESRLDGIANRAREAGWEVNFPEDLAPMMQREIDRLTKKVSRPCNQQEQQ